MRKRAQHLGTEIIMSAVFFSGYNDHIYTIFTMPIYHFVGFITLTLKNGCYVNNPSAPKERNLLKGAIRRVFSRSELRKEAISLSMIDWEDEDRPRVSKWSLCFECGAPTPTYLIQIDHIEPIIELTKSLDDYTWAEIVDRVWCTIDNLNPVCKDCHKVKTKEENKARRAYKKASTE